jgi:hypothetical protein
VEERHLVAGAAVAFADADRCVYWRFGDVGYGWEGEVDYVTGMAAVARTVIRGGAFRGSLAC